MSDFIADVARARMLAAPQRVTYCGTFAWMLGVVMALRALLVGSIGGGKAVTFAALVIVTFFLLSGSVMVKRSRLSYVLLAIAALVPLPGSVISTLNLIVSPLTDRWPIPAGEFAFGVFCFAQCLLIAYLLRNLFSKDAAAYVWKR